MTADIGVVQHICQKLYQTGLYRLYGHLRVTVFFCPINSTLSRKNVDLAEKLIYNSSITD